MRGTYRIRSALLGSLLVLAGCPLEMDEEPTGGEKVVELEPGLFRIDATASDSWVLFDLDEGAEAEEDGGWDLAFQRSLIAANGPKDVMVAKLDDVDFDAVEAAPESGYWLDPGRPTAGDGRGGGGDGLAFHNGDDWYEYDIGTHVLTPKARRVYVVVTDAGNAFAVQILRYYDDAGTAAVLTIRVKAIEPPVDPEEPERPNPEEPEEPEPGTYEEVRIDARDADTWVFFDFDTGEETDETSGWDIAFRRYTIATNGPEGVAVAWVDGKTLAGVDKPLAQEYRVDGPIAEGGEFAFMGDDPWFDYDMSTHVLTPKQRVYVLRTTEEAFVALQIVSYEVEGSDPGGFITFRYKEIE
ncbi:MAG TPA: HmuY family protein [Fredinandcohnia sp.]|nr:HmuY family protein [Fredinandcohnia sp.]